MRQLELDALTDEALDQVVSLAIGDRDAGSLDVLWQMIEGAEAVAEANKLLADRATFRRNTAEAEAARIKERVLQQLQARDLKAVAGSYGKFARQANGGRPPVKLLVEPDRLPDQFKRVKVEANLDEIHKVIKDGEVLDFVEVGERGEHLRLRV